MIFGKLSLGLMLGLAFDAHDIHRHMQTGTVKHDRTTRRAPHGPAQARTRPTDGPRQQLSPGARQLGSASSLERLTPEQLEFAPDLWRKRAEEARRLPS
jgi:hypothetical protein